MANHQRFAEARAKKSAAMSEETFPQRHLFPWSAQPSRRQPQAPHARTVSAAEGRRGPCPSTRAQTCKSECGTTVNGLQVEFTGQMSQLEKMLGQADDNLQDFGHALAESMADTNRMKNELEGLRLEHGKCPGVIAGLRRQIKDTKDALEMDYDMVEGSEGTVDAGSTETETPLDVRVKLGASAPAQRGRVKLGAGMTTRGLPLPMPAASGDDDADAAEDQMHQACTLSGIASLRKELAHTRMAHEQRGAAVAAKDAQIEELKADLVRLDTSLAQELDGRQALTEQVTVEMATMRKQLAEADQRQASLSGECWVCDRRD